MGRKRIARGKAREPVTISLPRDLVIRFDSILGERTRSRTIEYLIKRYLENTSANLNKFTENHHYICTNCDRTFMRPTYYDPEVQMCRIRSKNGRLGCQTYTIEYLGTDSDLDDLPFEIIKEGDEEE